eukprot:1390228-Heterocapsa_arctica.AAC.1
MSANDRKEKVKWSQFGAFEPEPIHHDTELQNVRAQLYPETSTKDQMAKENIQLRAFIHQAKVE